MKAYLSILSALMVSFHCYAEAKREFKYQNGKCVNSKGVEGFNPENTVYLSEPVEKTVSTVFGFYGGRDLNYSYYSLFDAECVDLSNPKVPISNLFKKIFPRVWIQHMNLKGSRLSALSSMIGDFDSPRAELEGLKDENSYMVVYSNIAASIDKYTELSGKSEKMSIGKGIWEDSIISQNDIYYSTNSRP